jgi:hypothetical protein
VVCRCDVGALTLIGATWIDRRDTMQVDDRGRFGCFVGCCCCLATALSAHTTVLSLLSAVDLKRVESNAKVKGNQGTVTSKISEGR